MIDQALCLFGWPETVFAEAFAQRPGAQTVDYFNILFSYHTGLRVNLSSSSLALTPRARYEVHGVTGSFLKFGIDPQEKALIDHTCPLTADFGQEDQNDYGSLSIIKNNYVENVTYPSKSGAYKNYFIQLAQSIQTNTSPPVSAVSALNVIRLIEVCEKSCQQKRSIQLKSLV